MSPGKDPTSLSPLYTTAKTLTLTSVAPPPRRLSRSLLQATIPAYLIPTTDDSLCSGPACCNSDYSASPFRLQALNSSLMTVGQQLYTTFYMSLYSDTQLCDASKPNSCCTANITKVWVDVGESCRPGAWGMGERWGWVWFGRRHGTAYPFILGRGGQVHEPLPWEGEQTRGPLSLPAPQPESTPPSFFPILSIGLTLITLLNLSHPTLPPHPSSYSPTSLTPSPSPPPPSSDPMLQVHFLSLGVSTTSFQATQDSYGMHMSIAPASGLTFTSGGVILTISVAGNVSTLCAPPDYMLGVTNSMPAICQVGGRRMQFKCRC